MNQKKLSIISFSFILLLLFSFMCTNKLFDTDLYYLIAQGRDIIENGFPDVTIQNWLYCVILAFTYNTFDVYGLVTLLAIMSAVMILLLFKFMNKPYIWFIMLMVIITISFSYWSLRPEILTFSLLLGTAMCIEKGGKWQWLIPILVLLEINLHASYWIFHFIIMIPYVFPNVFKLKDTRKRISILPLITSLGVIFINPYTYKNVLYLFNALYTSSSSIEIINENLSPSLSSYHTWVYIAGIILCTVLVVKKQISSTSFYMFVGFGITFIFGYKNIMLFTFGLIYILREIQPVNITLKNMYNYVIIVLCSFSIFSCIYRTNFDIYKYKGEDTFYNFTKEIPEGSTILALFADNNYFEFMGYNVYYDARPELYPNIDIRLLLTYKPSNREEYAQYINDTFDYDYIVTSNENLRLLEYAQDNCELLDKQTEYYLFKRKT